MAAFDAFVNPPREYSLIPFWFWNDDLTEAEIKRQIDDFEAHGVYGFVPHARIGLPESIGFMSENFLRFIRIAVEYAAEKNMLVILYDEGMYPSGSCAGKVVAADPRHATRCLQRRRKGKLGDDEELVFEEGRYDYVNRRSNGHIRGVHYGQDDGEPGAPPSGDLLNPEAMASFFHLVLDGFHGAVADHFGKTVRAVFTDEPDVLGRGHLRGVQPWTWGFEEFLQDHLGYDFRPHLPALWDDKAPDAARHQANFRRAVNARLEETYYAPYSQWCIDHGIALTGHPAGPDDIGVLNYFQMPCQDIVWRYIEPFKDKSLEGEQSTMAKCSVAAQRHYGRSRNGNECFGAYGWEFTYEEMMWVTNWLLVRGVNLLMPHAFYYSIRDKRRDERPPDVGPNNVWWDDYKTYADYCTRMCWLLSHGKQVCDIAVLGSPTSLPWRAARVLFESQWDFNYLDHGTLLNACRVEPTGVRVQDMHYRVVIVDGAQYATPEARAALQPLIDSGRVIAYGEPVPGLPHFADNSTALCDLLAEIHPQDVAVEPATPHLRYTHMRHDDADLYVFANEGPGPIDCALHVAAAGSRQWWDPETAKPLTDADPQRVQLAPYQLRVLRCEG